MKGYEEEIAKGRTQMQEALEGKLRGYVRTIKGRIGDNFGEIDALLANEETPITHFNTQHLSLQKRLEALDNPLEIRWIKLATIFYKILFSAFRNDPFRVLTTI